MAEMKYIFGPVPSRRLGLSLGISPIPKKVCNYSCIYCQLGRTDHMTNTRQMFFDVDEMMREFDEVLKNNIDFDVVTIVGEGEPTLYSGLGDLINRIKKKTKKPVAVITNGALFYDPNLRSELYEADIVLPTMDAYNDETLRKINRPYGTIDFKMISEGLIKFSQEYKGQLWIELMLIENINDDDASLSKYKEALGKFNYDRLYINTPVRPPAEPDVKAVNHEKINHAVEILGGTPIDLLDSEGFHSEIENDYEAIKSIIKRHPMNQFEIEGFLDSRGCSNTGLILKKLKEDSGVNCIHYKGYETYRLN